MTQQTGLGALLEWLCWAILAGAIILSGCLIVRATIWAFDGMIVQSELPGICGKEMK